MTPLTKYHDQLRLYKSHLVALESQSRYLKSIGLTEDVKAVISLKRQVRLCRNNFVKVSKRIADESQRSDSSLIFPI